MKCFSLCHAQVAKASSPEVTTDAIRHALEDPYPKTHYVVANLGAIPGESIRVHPLSHIPVASHSFSLSLSLSLSVLSSPSSAWVPIVLSFILPVRTLDWLVLNFM